MFIIRRSRIDDLPTLLKLARMVHFINLPADKDIITAKIIHSRNCFLKAAGGGPIAVDRNGRARAASDGGLGGQITASDLFMFTIEDAETGVVLGTSQVVARMGGPGNPIVSFKLSRREFFSQSLQSGATHTVATLHLDETGPTEIGGLILQPSSRGSKLGKFLSLIRFHFIALHRQRFADRMLAEMMAPITPDGHNLLWEYLGRRFINLTYTEADRFCQHSREFMTSLLPREDLYLTLLPPEARSLVAQVGPETVPARKMLEKLGFEHHDIIDPFDGGPYLHADTDKIPIVRDTKRVELAGSAPAAQCKQHAYVSVLDPDGEFRAVSTPCALDDKAGLRLPAKSIKALQSEPGAQVGLTLIDTPTKKPASKAPPTPPAAAKPAPRRPAPKHP